MIILLSTLNVEANTLIYKVSFPKLNRHYAQVEITIPAKLLTTESVRLKVPVWTPGSYKVREFSRNLDSIFASRGKQQCTVTQLNKNTWEIRNPGSRGDLQISYSIYGAEYGVRESYIGNDMIFLHGVSAFAYVEGMQDKPIRLKLEIPNGWVSHVALPSAGQNEYTCSNYDLLADSPVAIGDFETTEYESGGVPHRVVMLGKGNYDLERIRTDFKKISDEQVALFGGKHPSEPIYIHFIQNTDNGGGGLEHLNCQTSQVQRFVYSDEKKYRKFLALVSHEYFHLWNVKRIRPIELGPFDYDKEVYTDMLWIAEGITSYYDDLILKRAGIHNREDYLAAVSENINRFENQKGKAYMSLAASSFNAWIKAYLPDENSKNVTISYYNKGMLVALLLDQVILESTQGKRSLDHVMRELFERFYIREDRGFSHAEFIQVCSEIAEIDLKWFFDDCVFGTKALDYDRFTNFFGLEMPNKANPQKAYLGINVKKDNGRMIVNYVEFDSPAEKAGLSINDELIAFDGWRLNDELSAELSRYKANDSFILTFSRRGAIRETSIELGENPTLDFDLRVAEDPDDAQTARLEQWLR